MPFTPFSADQYRALDPDALIERQSMVVGMLDADTLPDGVTDEMVISEGQLIRSEIDRRNRENEIRSARLNAVIAGSGRVVESNAADSDAADSTRSLDIAPVQHRGVQMVREEDYTDTFEYRKALYDFVAYRRAIPADMAARAARSLQVRAAGDPVSVSFPDGYANVTDPTFAANASTSPIIPFSISDEVFATRQEAGQLYPLASTSYYPGGFAVPVSDFSVQGKWISDKQTAPYQTETDVDTIVFGYKQYEQRIARTLLMDALLKESYKSVIARRFNEGYGRDMDVAMISGNGSMQPLGILKDPRVIDQTLNAGTGKALVIEATAEDLASWDWWIKTLYKPQFNRLYRGDGSWIIGDSTFGTYLLTLKDDNNRPLVQLDLASSNVLPKIRGNNVYAVTPSLLPDFDTATAGDVVAIFANLKSYFFNYQPGMPLSMRQWVDNDTNTVKTALNAVVDGKMTDVGGTVIIKKKASA